MKKLLLILLLTTSVTFGQNFLGEDKTTITQAFENDTLTTSNDVIIVSHYDEVRYYYFNNDTCYKYVYVNYTSSTEDIVNFLNTYYEFYPTEGYWVGETYRREEFYVKVDKFEKEQNFAVIFNLF